MYQRYYGLTHSPFHITPDPDFLYLSQSHKQALGTIIYGIEQRKGITAVLGEVGLGKTTILRSALAQMDTQHNRVIYHLNPYLSFRSFLETLLQEFDQKPEDQQDEGDLVSQLQHILIDEYGKGKTVILCIDEAQNMPMSTMEGLCILSNLETEKDKLIQIVLVGQPELTEILKRYELRKLDQRIALRTTILPLTTQESYEYIQHRLDLAGAKNSTIFSKGALSQIVRHAKGNPRQINRLCDNALVTGVGYNKNPVTAKIVKEVISDLAARPSRAGWKLVPLAAGVLILVLGLVALMFLNRSQLFDNDRVYEIGQSVDSRDDRNQSSVTIETSTNHSDPGVRTLVERTKNWLTASIPERLMNVRKQETVDDDLNMIQPYQEVDQPLESHGDVDIAKKTMGADKASIPAVSRELSDVVALEKAARIFSAPSQKDPHLQGRSEDTVTQGGTLTPIEKPRLAQGELSALSLDPIDRSISQAKLGKRNKSSTQSIVHLTEGKKNLPIQEKISSVSTQKKGLPLQKFPSKKSGGVASPSAVSKIIKEGETLAGLMNEVYGSASPTTLRLVLSHNHHIVNVRKIYPGQQILFPPLTKVENKKKLANAARGLVSHTGEELHTNGIFTESSQRMKPNQNNQRIQPQRLYAMAIVQEGDTLEKMAKVIYGSSDPINIQRVLDYNPQVLNPTTIFPGQKILFPRMIEGVKALQSQSSQDNFPPE